MHTGFKRVLAFTLGVSGVLAGPAISSIRALAPDNPLAAAAFADTGTAGGGDTGSGGGGDTGTGGGGDTGGPHSDTGTGGGNDAGTAGTGTGGAVFNLNYFPPAPTR